MMLAIFDFDGTLVDSLTDLAISSNYALAKNGFPTHPLEKYREFVGDGLIRLFERALPQGSEMETIQKVRSVYEAYYNKHMQDNSRPYDGIVPLLTDLKSSGIKLAVLSNKPHQFTRPLVESIFPDTFDLAFGQQEGYKVKPDPRTALEIIAAAGVDKGHAVMIGDTSIDMNTAKNVGIYAVGVTWGFRQVSELIEAGANEIAKDCDTLKNILINYLTR